MNDEIKPVKKKKKKVVASKSKKMVSRSKFWIGCGITALLLTLANGVAG